MQTRVDKETGLEKVAFSEGDETHGRRPGIGFYKARRRAMAMMSKHIQTVIAGLVLAVLVWVGTAVSDSRVEIAALRERIDHLSHRMDEAATDRYRTVDAQRDFALRDQAIQNLERRVERLEQNVE